MGMGISVRPTPGKSIVGYKVYRNTADVYGGASPGITAVNLSTYAGSYSISLGIASLSTDYVYFPQFDSPINKSGTIYTLYIGIWHAANSDYTSNDLSLLICNNDTDATGEYLEIVSENNFTMYFNPKQSDYYKIYEINFDSGISVTAGQVICLKVDKSGYSALDNYHIMNTDKNKPYLHTTSDYTVGDKIYLADFTSTTHIHSDFQNHYGIEVRGNFTGSWVEQTNGYSGYELHTVDSAVLDTTGSSTVTHEIDLGEEVNIAMIYQTSGTGNIYEIEIRSSTSDPWVSVYYGYPGLYGQVEGANSYYIGFPYSTRYLKYTITGDSGYSGTYTFYIQKVKEAHNGTYLPIQGGSYDLLTLNIDESVTQPYWYSLLPIDINGNIGEMSVPISNRLNIS